MVNSIRIRALRPSEYRETAQRLYYNMRKQDHDEAALLGADNLPYVLVSITLSREVYGAWKGDVLLAVLGVTEQFHFLDGTVARCVWCLGTEDLDRNHRAFVKYGPPILNYLASKYGRLGNFISAGNKKALLWIRRMGAMLLDPVEMGEGVFIPFVIEERSEDKDVWCCGSIDGCHDRDADAPAEPGIQGAGSGL